jgi:hypothetical protein
MYIILLAPRFSLLLFEIQYIPFPALIKYCKINHKTADRAQFWQG